MSFNSWLRAGAISLAVGALAAALPAAAQEAQGTYVDELVVVAPARGPAWWKVSKGDAHVWIFGLPLNTPEELKWDRSTLERRLKGARLVVGVYNETARFDQGGNPKLPPEMKEEVSAIARRLGLRPSASFGMTADQFGGGRPVVAGARPGPRDTVLDLIDLRFQYARRNGTCFCLLKQVNEIVRRAGVKRVTPPVNTYDWSATVLAPENPRAKRCLQAIITSVKTPRSQYVKAGELWAKGDVRGMLAAEPPGLEPDCEFVWPGSRERTIAFQTALIAQALDRPGKVIAAARISHLVASDGILERLRAQGFTIHDPSQPLED